MQPGFVIHQGLSALLTTGPLRNKRHRVLRDPKPQTLTAFDRLLQRVRFRNPDFQRFRALEGRRQRRARDSYGVFLGSATGFRLRSSGFEDFRSPGISVCQANLKPKRSTLMPSPLSAARYGYSQSCQARFRTSAKTCGSVSARKGG